MAPFDAVTGRDYMISQSGSVIILAGRVKSFFPYKDRFSRSQRSRVVSRASYWDCDSFYVSKTKRKLHDRKTEHFKALTQDCHASPNFY